MTTKLILEILYTDSWFTPSKGSDLETININGIAVSIPVSYYHIMQHNNYMIIIRVSNHCTYLETWVRPALRPDKSLLNLSIVLSDTPCTYNKVTKPVQKKNGDKYTFFVVEQYAYKLSLLSTKDFKKIINRIKRLETELIVFTDPLKKKPDRRASRTVLTPDDINGNPIDPYNNAVHPRQMTVFNNKNNEVDFDGNVLTEKEKQKLYEKIMLDISKIVKQHLSNI